ncbi:hypothetical protein T439DRAFT_323600 [Meredithblackwellia eburnea MCA 4105]
MSGAGLDLSAFLNMDLLNNNTIQPSGTATATPSELHLSNLQNDLQTQGMSFAEIFRHYLAPEVAKLPPSYNLASSLHQLQPENPFAVDAPENASPNAPTSASAFTPPLIPGSPIGAFSPDSASGAGGSLLSFGDMDDDALVSSSTTAPGSAHIASDDWASSIDPTFLGGSAIPSAFDNLPLLPPLPPLPTTNTSTADEQDHPAPALDQEILIKTEDDLFSIPSSHRAPSTIPEENEDNDDDEDEDEDEDDEDDDDDAPLATRRGNAATTKRGAKRQSSSAPAGKKAKTSVDAFATPTLHLTSSKSTLPPVPDWTDKPDPESYKKLSSKEKRQLRNKISARNFRHRRKEYITTLEDEISSRDTIISQLRDEVGTMRVENKDLKGEVKMLKAKWDEMMEKMTAYLPQPASTSTSAAGLGLNPGKMLAQSASASAASTSAAASATEEWALDSPKPSSPAPLASTSTAQMVTRKRGQANAIAKPNLSKDVPPTLKRNTTGSWATAGGFGSMGGGYMPVHTTLLPEFNLSVKPAFANANPFFSNQSFNPALNNLTQAQLNELPAMTAHLRTGFAAPSPSSAAEGTTVATSPTATGPRTGTFESFFESNPFWLRPQNVEEYRGQLYGKVANNMAGTAAAHKEQQSSSASSSSPSPNTHLPVPSGFRPAFFTSPASGMLGYKEPRDIASTSLSSPSHTWGGSSSADLLAFQSPREDQRLRDERTALVAGLATQTLFNRMAAAFVDAFAGPSAGGVPTSDDPLGKGKGRMMSSDKVASVLSGRSTLQVVPAPPSTAAQDPVADLLAAQMGALDIKKQSSQNKDEFSSSSSSSGVAPQCNFDEVVKRWVGKKTTTTD